MLILHFLNVKILTRKAKNLLSHANSYHGNSKVGSGLLLVTVEKVKKE